MRSNFLNQNLLRKQKMRSNILNPNQNQLRKSQMRSNILHPN
ncbi:MAG: hypothetical protein U7126_02250 [Microcoleus sp.]